MSDQTVCRWDQADEQALEELRAEASRPVKNVRALVARERELARRPLAQRTPPTWAVTAARERDDEAALLRAYANASPEARAWVDSLVDEQLAGLKVPEIRRHFELVAVLKDWRAGKLTGNAAVAAHDDEEAACA